MSVKALRKQLMAAIAMVVVAAVALSSSTYAWFANNNKVTATGMQVTAMSNQSFLLISSTNTTATDIQTENKTTTALTVSDAEAKLFPAAHTTISKTSDAVVGNWYTGFSADPAEVTMDESTKTILTDYAGYVIHKQVWITVAKNSTPVENLKVKATIGNKNTGDITQAMVLVTSTTAAAEMSSASTSPTTVLTDTQISDTTVVPLDIYIYINGNDSAVYTNNYNGLDTATITLEFYATTVTT